MAPMVLYLCQHGDALAKDVDPERRLSERGTTDVCNMANALSGSITTTEILHSGKLRARQTAELLHERLAPDATIRAGDGLGPNDPEEVFVTGLGSRDDNLLVVGHMPFVSRLASRLIGVERDVLAFQPGTVAALSRDGDGGWMLSWMMTPDLARD